MTLMAGAKHPSSDHVTHLDTRPKREPDSLKLIMEGRVEEDHSPLDINENDESAPAGGRSLNVSMLTNIQNHPYQEEAVTAKKVARQLSQIHKTRRPSLGDSENCPRSYASRSGSSLSRVATFSTTVPNTRLMHGKQRATTSYARGPTPPFPSQMCATEPAK